jgi:hypothetical protein
VKQAYRKKHPLPLPPRQLKTHCKYGHPLSGDNLSTAALAKGLRVCRTCNNERQRDHYYTNLEHSRTYIREYARKRRAEDNT